MIRFDKESPVVCLTCGKPALRRELNVEGRFTSFDTHQLTVTAKEWFAAINRMDAFLTKAVAFEKKLTSLLPIKLERGCIVFIDVVTVRPTACEKRSHVVIEATVKAFAGQVGVKTEAMELKGLRVDRAVKALAALALPAVDLLQREYEAGRF